MSDYEARKWAEVNAYWTKKAERRSLPPKVQASVKAVRSRANQAAKATGRFVDDVTPQIVKNMGNVALDHTLEPTIRAVVSLLEYTTEKVQDLMDETPVFQHHRDSGHDVTSLADLHLIDLQALDGFTRRMPIQWRTTGIAEGAAMGALAFVPGPGTLASIAADLVVMHALSTGIATRIAYAYGIDPTSEEERHHLDKMLRRVWTEQAGKAGAVKNAADAFKAGAQRVRWSEKFRDDHRIAAALEALMKKAYGVDNVPIGKVIKRLPAVGVVTSAGINSHVLGSLATTSIRYGQTVYLAKKYDLPLPPNLEATAAEDDSDEGSADVTTPA